MIEVELAHADIAMDSISLTSLNNVASISLSLTDQSGDVFDSDIAVSGPNTEFVFPADSLGIRLRLTVIPSNISSPVTAKLEVKACFELPITTPVAPVTEQPTTPAVITTEKGIETTTEAPAESTIVSEVTTTKRLSTSMASTAVPVVPTTTELPCEVVTGMNDSFKIPASSITVSSGVPTAVRPTSDTPWQSDPVSDKTPSIVIDLTPDSPEDTLVSIVKLPEVTNTDNVVITVINEQGVEDVVFDSAPQEVLDLPTGTEGSEVKIEFTPTNPNVSVTAQLEIIACLKEVCEKRDGMNDTDVIPDFALEVCR